MIIIKLKEGLGNQMFQYAFGKALSINKNTRLKLDISFYETSCNTAKRHYSLDCFNVVEDFAKEEDLNKVLKSSVYYNLLSRVSFYRIPYYKKNYIEEESPFFDAKMLITRRNVIFDGWWANEKYFKSIEDIIRQEFTLKSTLLNTNFIEIKKEINSTNSVSIHFRRSDYIHDIDNPNDLFSACKIEYYLQAIEYIQKRIQDPFFYIFSDDPKWVKEHFNHSFPFKIVSGNYFKDYEELLLMSNCKHNIMANSTFSWWGAWLNTNPSKIVIAPQTWYNDKMLQNFYETSDFIPLNWIRI